MRGMLRLVLTATVAVTVTTMSYAAGPQEYQTSASPAHEGGYPVTRVQMPERMLPAASEVISAPWFYNFAQGSNDNFLPPGRKAGGESHWYDNFAAGENDIFRSAPKRTWVEVEDKPVSTVVTGSTMAYGSMILPDDGEDDVTEADGPRIPKAFSFDSDDSPIILAEVTSPGPEGRVYAQRRIRDYGMASVRRPAEIIERDPYNYAPTPRPGQDTPAMVPPAGGQVRRAEVKLPTSSQGLGMASGYFPGR